MHPGLKELEQLIGIPHYDVREAAYLAWRAKWIDQVVVSTAMSGVEKLGLKAAEHESLFNQRIDFAARALGEALVKRCAVLGERMAISQDADYYDMSATVLVLRPRP